MESNEHRLLTRTWIQERINLKCYKFPVIPTLTLTRILNSCLRHSIVQIFHSKQGQTFIQNSAMASVLQLYQWVLWKDLHLLSTTSNLPHQLCFTQSSALIPAVILSQQPLPAQQEAPARVNTEFPGMAGNTPSLLVTGISTLCPVFDVGLTTISHLNPS